MKYKTIIDKYNKEQNSLSMDEIEMRLPPELFHISPPILINIANIQPSCYYIQNLLVIFAEDLVISDIIILILLSTIYETKMILTLAAAVAMNATATCFGKPMAENCKPTTEK